MIKYHDNMRGPMYGPDHMLTDNWSPADAVPGTFIRVFFRIDCPAFDAMHGHFPNDAARAAFYVDARAVLARFNVAEGIRMDHEPAREHLHIHPQEISGTVESCKVQPIAEALSACSSFTCRWVDLYEEISTMSNEEFTAHLDGQKQEIKADLLAAFTTKRSNLYIVPSSFSGPCFTLAEKYSIPRWACEHGQDAHCVRYMQHLLDACVQSGEIVTAQTKHGTGYRTAKKQARKAC